MSPILLIALSLYFTVLALVMFVCFCSSPYDKGVLGRANRMMTVVMPKVLGDLVYSIPICGPRIVSCSNGTYDYVCNKPNPLLQFLYLFLVVGGYVIFLVEGYHLIPNRMVGEIHRTLSHAIVWTTLVSFAVASTKNPGVITKETAYKYDHFEHDGLLYVNRVCKTCNVPKLARSKHCGLCGHCVARFDHHCPWINVCVGEDNYRYFIYFLFWTLTMLTYGSYVVAGILVSVVLDNRLFEQVYVNRSTGEKVGATYSIVFQYMMLNHALLIMLFFLLAVMGIVLAGFLGYHIYLIIVGKTTNETNKWGTVNYIYKHRERLIKREEAHIERKRKEAEQKRQERENGPPLPANASNKKPKSDTGDSDDFVEIKRCAEKDLLNPDVAPVLNKRLASEFPLPCPPNIYNRTLRENFGQVFFPSYYQNSPPKPSDAPSSSRPNNKKKRK